MRIQKILLAGMLLMSIATASAQTTETTANVFKPYWYIQAQGGAQHTLGEVSYKDLISGNAQLNGGWQFHKFLGARFSLNGWQSKGGWQATDYRWKWNYISGGLDVTVDLCNWWGGYNPKRLCSVNLIAGGGINVGWNNTEANNIYQNTNSEIVLGKIWDGTKARAYGRFGLGIDFRICDMVSLGLECDANLLSDTYNSKPGKNANSDWYFNALAGVRINFGNTHSTKTTSKSAQQTKIAEKTVIKPTKTVEEKPASIVATAVPVGTNAEQAVVKTDGQPAAGAAAVVPVVAAGAAAGTNAEKAAVKTDGQPAAGAAAVVPIVAAGAAVGANAEKAAVKTDGQPAAAGAAAVVPAAGAAGAAAGAAIPTGAKAAKAAEKADEKAAEKVTKQVNNDALATGNTSMRRDVFFTINSTYIREAEGEKIEEIIDFLKKNPKAKVKVTGVADKGTGTHAINERLAKGRADVVSKRLQKNGIKANRITVESYGDRIQPFEENDMNRVSICVVI